jgi:hypothetical protein
MAEFATYENFDELFPAQARGEFWMLVRKTLVEVFKTDPQVADRYRQKIEGARDNWNGAEREANHLAGSAAGAASEEELAFDPRTARFNVSRPGASPHPDLDIVPHSSEGFFGARGAITTGPMPSSKESAAKPRPSAAERIAVHHTSALSIAADLAGWREPIPDEKLRAFLKLQHDYAKKFGIDLDLPSNELRD